LDELALLGLATNQAFLRDCLTAPAFAEGRATTKFLAEAFPEGWQPNAAALAKVRALAAILWAEDRAGDDPCVWRRMDGFRIMGARRPAYLNLEVTDDFGTVDVQLTRNALGYGAAVGGVVASLSCDRLSGDRRIDGRPVHGRIDGDAVHVAHGSLSLSATVRPAIDLGSETELSAAGAESVLAPLPGLVTVIAVKPGDKVAKGDMALQIEAMKLIHTLTVEVDGTVRAVHCKVGDTVAAGATLIEMSTEAEE
jgi:acetyl/propionyl-CoA carboxylase alpha subunit